LLYKTIEERTEQLEQRWPLSLGWLGAANKILRKGFRNRREKCASKRDLEKAAV